MHCNDTFNNFGTRMILLWQWFWKHNLYFVNVLSDLQAWHNGTSPLSQTAAYLVRNLHLMRMENQDFICKTMNLSWGISSKRREDTSTRITWQQVVKQPKPTFPLCLFHLMDLRLVSLATTRKVAMNGQIHQYQPSKRVTCWSLNLSDNILFSVEWLLRPK